jgi:chromate transporter
MKPNVSPATLFFAFLRLGLTAFGGPVAHLAYFREEFVHRRRWLSDAAYADLLALCQFLPGPASSQVGMAIGLQQAGYRGALAAWVGFTLPSALLLILFALSLSHWDDALPSGVIDGLKIVAVAVVAQAVWGMGKSLCPDWPRRLMAISAAGVLLLFPATASQIGIILMAGLIGLGLRAPASTVQESLASGLSRGSGMVWLGLFALLLLVLPLLVSQSGNPALALFDAFYRAGSLVFGGGHVVLPLLQSEIIGNGWVDREIFLAGYGATQAVPGPLFTFSAFLGAANQGTPTAWAGGTLALLAIFLPAFLLVAGALPFWEKLRHHPKARAALNGINAAVVGILLAAFYDPVWTSAIHRIEHLLLAALALAALTIGKQAPWRVVIACGLIGGMLW